MSGSNRTRRWREKRSAEGKKSFTVLLSIQAQQIIKSEKEKTGDTYSEILERALSALNRPERIRPEYSRHERRPEQARKPEPEKIQPNPPVVSSPDKIKPTRILIDDLKNYEFGEDRDFSYKKGLDYLNRKENFLKRLTKLPGKKKWFR
jgi:hypothetical protein